MGKYASNTSVSPEKSQAEIQNTLRKYGADRFGTMEEKNKVSHRGKALAEIASEFDKILAWLNSRMNETKPPKPDHKPFEHNDWSEEKMV